MTAENSVGPKRWNGSSIGQLGCETCESAGETPVTGRNCGVCEKCLRTKLNFMALGAPLFPTSLPETPTPMQIFRLKAQETSEHRLPHRDRRSCQKSEGLEGSWLYALRIAIIKNWLFLTVRNLVYVVRTLAKRMLPRAIVLWIRRATHQISREA